MTKRLDQILIEQGAITEPELKDALLRQKACGGRFGSHLVYYRHISEDQLVEALSTQMGCGGVVISKVEIPEATLKLIPKKVALARRVIPFEYDEIRNVLKIACLNPGDHDLAKELAFVAHGKDIELHVAAEIALNTAIARYYLGRETSLDDNLLIEIPEDATRLDGQDGAQGREEAAPVETSGLRILLVTDEEYAPRLVQSVLERYGHAVEISDSMEGIADRVREEGYERVCIKRDTTHDPKQLEARIRKVSPTTTVSFHEDISDLILRGGDDLGDGVRIANLNLLTSLLAAQADRPENHAARVGEYVDRLCRRLRLPRRDRVSITHAAYLHDVAGYCYDVVEDGDNRKIIEHSARLLTSMGYPETIVGILRSTFTDPDEGMESQHTIETLGGNIITAVELICHSLPANECLSLDRLDVLRKKLRDLAGRMLPHEIVEPLIRILQEDVLVASPAGKGFQVMLLAEEASTGRALEMAFDREGFGVVSESSVGALLKLYERRRPDVLVLALQCEPSAACSLVDRLRGGGVCLEETPVLVVSERALFSDVPDLLEIGIEDVIVCREGFGLLVSKLRKLAARIASEREAATQQAGSTAGASGRLTDMNLIDLVQALGPGQKTVRITVRNNGYEAPPMTMYLREGSIVFAELGALSGPEAIYECLSWSTGAWSVEPVAPDDIPPSNSDESNESILMEGCRLLDERAKAGHLL